MTLDELYEQGDLAAFAVPDVELETEAVEKKQALDRPVGEAICALANTPRFGGIVAVGIAPDGSVKGLDPIACDEKLKGVLDRVQIDLGLLSTRKVEAGEGKVVLLIRVRFSQNKVVTLADGTAFRRVGRSTVRLRPDDVLELRYARGERSFELEPAQPFNAAALDPDLCVQFSRELAKDQRASIKSTLEQDLETKRLVTRLADNSLHLTRAGLLVLGKRPIDVVPGAVIRFLRYDGVDSGTGAALNLVQDRTFEGPLPTQVRSAIDFIETQVRRFDFLQKDGTFSNLPEYPREAWEEAVINAAVHRAYSITTAQTVVKMFDDRLTVTSPGSFPGIVDADWLSNGGHGSVPRNPVLMGALQTFKFVKHISEGHRRMRQEMLERGLPPPLWMEEREHRSFVQVSLRNDYETIRQRGQATQVDWGAIERGLRDESLLIYRQKALNDWRNVAGRNQPSPGAVIDAAVALVASQWATEEERQAVLDLLWQQERYLGDRLAGVLNDVLRGRRFGEPAMNRLAYLASASDAFIERVRSWLTGLAEARRPMPDWVPAAVDWCFATLTQRMSREPLPPRQWTLETVRLAGEFTTPGAKQFLTRVTGKPE